MKTYVMMLVGGVNISTCLSKPVTCDIRVVAMLKEM